MQSLQSVSWLRVRNLCLLRSRSHVAALRSLSSGFDLHGVVPVGKHKGRTYEDLMQNEPRYIQWLQKTDNGGTGPLAPFIEHLKSNPSQPPKQGGNSLGSEVLRFGKHRGKTFQAIVVDDPSYISFVKRAVQEEGSSNQQMLRFVEFLEGQQAMQSNQGGRTSGTPEHQPVTSAPELRKGSWTLKMGKHKGKTFQEVYDEDRSYCAWAVKTAAGEDSSGALSSFVEYVKARDATPSSETSSEGRAAPTSPSASASKVLSLASREISFGKHSGKTYEEIANEDASYCEWIARSAAEGNNRNPKVAEFASYLKARAESPVQQSPVQMQTDEASETGTSQTSAAGADLEEPLPIDEYKVLEGLHKGRSFKDVFDKEQDYCRWLVEHYFDNGVPGAPMWHFVAYTVNKWRNGENAPSLDDE